MTLPGIPTTATEPLTYHRSDVLGLTMSYADTGRSTSLAGATPNLTFLFLHGNPTSAYLWRTVIPHVAPLGRCIAPDLLGMGHSDKLPDPGPGSYGYLQHRAYLDELLTTLDIGARVVLVLHDWGSGLGFDWARRHPERVAGIAYTEAIVAPLHLTDLGDTAPILQRLRGPDGDRMVLHDNFFIEQVLPAWVLRDLTPEEHDTYRAAYRTPGEDRRPTLSWPRELPIVGDGPPHTTAIATAYGRWLATSPLPKLFINAEPGAFLTGAARDFCRTWPNQTEITVPGIHLVQEDSGHMIGTALHQWAATTFIGREPGTRRSGGQPAQT
jgi:haloalkane dehalogenase